MRVSYRCPHCENNGYRTFGVIGITERVEYDATEDRGIPFPIYDSGKDLRERQHRHPNITGRWPQHPTISPVHRDPEPEEEHIRFVDEDEDDENESDLEPEHERGSEIEPEDDNSPDEMIGGDTDSIYTVNRSRGSKTREKENNDASSEL